MPILGPGTKSTLNLHLTTALWGSQVMIHYPHFTKEETEAKVTQWQSCPGFHFSGLSTIPFSLWTNRRRMAAIYGTLILCQSLHEAIYI